MRIKELTYYDRSFGVTELFANARGYAIIPMQERMAEAAVLDIIMTANDPYLVLADFLKKHPDKRFDEIRNLLANPAKFQAAYDNEMRQLREISDGNI
jgi:hypothetical protein